MVNNELADGDYRTMAVNKKGEASWVK
jgi:hypothetical protein